MKLNLKALCLKNCAQRGQNCSLNLSTIKGALHKWGQNCMPIHTNEDVAGCVVDDARVAAILASANIVFAHNAAFDRPMVEKRGPAFEKTNWGCSLVDIDWGRWRHGQLQARLSPDKYGLVR